MVVFSQIQSALDRITYYFRPFPIPANKRTVGDMVAINNQPIYGNTQCTQKIGVINGIGSIASGNLLSVQVQLIIYNSTIGKIIANFSSMFPIKPPPPLPTPWYGYGAATAGQGFKTCTIFTLGMKFINQNVICATPVGGIGGG
jgi:hypothetical protein